MARLVNLGLKIRLFPEATEDEIVASIRRLEAELEKFDVNVEPTPSGVHARTTPAPAVYALSLTVFPLVLPQLVEFLEAWALRDPKRAITLELDVDGRTVALNFPSRKSGAQMIEQLLSAAVA